MEHHRPATILIADDDADVRRSFHMYLEECGYGILEAADGEQALAQVGLRPDLILLDLRMPRMGGLEMLGQLRRAEPDMPVIVVSGAGETHDVVAALRLGAMDYLLKPLDDLAILGHAVGRVMEILSLRRERQAYQEHLEEHVRLRTAELMKANAAKDEFLAMVSHELRTPLTPAMLVLDGALADRECSDALREDLSMAKGHLEMECRLIDDLLDLSKSISGEFQLRRCLCDAHSVIQRAISTCQANLGIRKLMFDTALQAESSILSADAGRLQQVFYNLLANAVKFTPDGGMIRVQSFNAVEEGIAKLVVAVTDTGIGMTPETLSKAFAPFEQADRSVTRRYGGLGIGLAICRTIVDLHDGRIEGASKGPGCGSKFTVTLPLGDSGQAGHS